MFKRRTLAALGILMCGACMADRHGIVVVEPPHHGHGHYALRRAGGGVIVVHFVRQGGVKTEWPLASSGVLTPPLIYGQLGSTVVLEPCEIQCTYEVPATATSVSAEAIETYVNQECLNGTGCLAEATGTTLSLKGQCVCELNLLIRRAGTPGKTACSAVLSSGFSPELNALVESDCKFTFQP